MLEDKTHGEVVGEEINNDREFREDWESSGPARVVSVTLIRYRAENDLTQRDLAEKLGIKQPSVARLEGGEHTPSLQTLEMISERLGIEFVIDIVPAERAPHLITKKAQERAVSHVRHGATVRFATS